jgi:hypothetical protein
MSNYWPVLRALRDNTFLIDGKEWAMKADAGGGPQWKLKSHCEYCGCEFAMRWNKPSWGGKCDLGYYSGRHCSALCRRLHEEERSI